MITTICYKVKNTDRTYLSYFTYKTREKAQLECNELNTKRPPRLWNGEKINWNEIDYFFVSEQPIFED